jgi:ParB-like chromosome segregation protein Spo0J
MMKKEMFEIARIYVPVKRRATLEPAKVEALAADIMANGMQTPILVRPDGERFVLVEGLHRLEAAKSLGETSISGYRVSSRKH